MTGNEYQKLAMRTNDGKLSISEFTMHLKNTGAYIGEDHHIYGCKGNILSRKCRNGYYLLRKMINGINYQFMEHRVAWCWYYGYIDESLVINHKDYDRTNNDINNLELITQKENVLYSIEKIRANTKKGTDSSKAKLTEKDVQMIRYLCKSGWMQKEVHEMYKNSDQNTISRVVTGARYGNVLDAASVVAIYPTFVERQTNKTLDKKERILNAALGLSGESGEINDMIKKHYFHGHDLDINELMLELGDLLFYLYWIANEFEIDLADICFANYDKLIKRYPEGFSEQASINRVE